VFRGAPAAATSHAPVINRVPFGCQFTPIGALLLSLRIRRGARRR